MNKKKKMHTIEVYAIPKQFYRAGLLFTNKPCRTEVTDEILQRLTEEKNLVVTICEKTPEKKNTTKRKTKKRNRNLQS